MRRPAIVRVHLIAATGALALIAMLLVSTTITDLVGDAVELHDLRLAIMLAVPVLVACLAGAALTGRRLAGRSRAAVIRRKQRRMLLIAAAGIAVLVPCAVALYLIPAAGGYVLALQITELIAGAVNLTLLTLNYRDGRGIRRNARRRPRRRTPVTQPVHTGA